MPNSAENPQTPEPESQESVEQLLKATTQVRHAAPAPGSPQPIFNPNA